MDLADLTEVEVLERVDEYSLYSFYLGFEPVVKATYSSPLREGDLRPSFGMFVRSYGGNLPHEYLWKDNALPAPNHGDIFDLIRNLYGLETRLEAMVKVACDFQLVEGNFELAKHIQKVPKIRPAANIRVKSKNWSKEDLDYWQQYNINADLLAKYNTTAVDYYYLYDDQVDPYFPRKMYAYRIYDKYQLYCPSPKYFTNNWTDSCIPGFQQLESYDLLIITKAMKDVIHLRSLGFESIAPKGENHIPNPQLLEYVKKRYKRVVTLFDNDGKTSEHLYPFEHIQIPLLTGIKDPTDYCAIFGPEKTKELILDLL